METKVPKVYIIFTIVVFFAITIGADKCQYPIKLPVLMEYTYPVPEPISGNVTALVILETEYELKWSRWWVANMSYGSHKEIADVNPRYFNVYENAYGLENTVYKKKSENKYELKLQSPWPTLVDSLILTFDIGCRDITVKFRILKPSNVPKKIRIEDGGEITEIPETNVVIIPNKWMKSTLEVSGEGYKVHEEVYYQNSDLVLVGGIVGKDKFTLPYEEKENTFKDEMSKSTLTKSFKVHSDINNIEIRLIVVKSVSNSIECIVEIYSNYYTANKGPPVVYLKPCAPYELLKIYGYPAIAHPQMTPGCVEITGYGYPQPNDLYWVRYDKTTIKPETWFQSDSYGPKMKAISRAMYHLPLNQNNNDHSSFFVYAAQNTVDMRTQSIDVESYNPITVEMDEENERINTKVIKKWQKSNKTSKIQLSCIAKGHFHEVGLYTVDYRDSAHDKETWKPIDKVKTNKNEEYCFTYTYKPQSNGNGPLLLCGVISEYESKHIFYDYLHSSP